MDFTVLLRIVGEEPVFETGLLLAGDVHPADVRQQLSRWVKKGWVHQLRRGLYVLAPPFQKVRPHPFLVANRLVSGSYVSLHSALAHHGIIPEYVPVTTSVTSGRPGCWDTALGCFEYRHLKPELVSGFRAERLAPGQEAFVATPAKALLDLIHLVAGADSFEYLSELRLESLDQADVANLFSDPVLAKRPKLRRAARHLTTLAEGR